ncbi:VanZ family protein [Aquimarina aquimarini]|uniref:VanZ family protein n=1 Tax=Aquimarina aquimarini TaxID=1191734 RepID=UPI000D552789|nr:VanZ family protein [Aquimarina aquimarini]
MIIQKLLGHKFLLCQLIILTILLTWVSLAKLVTPVDFKVEGSDKIGHFIAYAVFCGAWFLFLFFSEKVNKNLKQSLLIASVICVLYGMLMELLQAFLTTYRSPEWYDVVANTSGTVFVALVIVMFRATIRKYKRNKQKIN